MCSQLERTRVMNHLTKIDRVILLLVLFLFLLLMLPIRASAGTQGAITDAAGMSPQTIDCSDLRQLRGVVEDPLWE